MVAGMELFGMLLAAVFYQKVHAAGMKRPTMAAIELMPVQDVRLLDVIMTTPTDGVILTKKAIRSHDETSCTKLKPHSVAMPWPWWLYQHLS
jgi:hypothetical protein